MSEIQANLHTEPWRRLLRSLPRILTGILLVSAAELKAYQLSVGEASVSLVLSSRNLATVAVVAEFLLGWSLIVGVWPDVTRKLAIAVFLGFAAYSGYLWARGYSTCSCLGPLSVMPRQMFFLDLLVVALLLLSAPARGGVTADVGDRAMGAA